MFPRVTATSYIDRRIDFPYTAAEERIDHGCIADDNCDKSFAYCPAAGSLGTTDGVLFSLAISV